MMHAVRLQAGIADIIVQQGTLACLASGRCYSTHWGRRYDVLTQSQPVARPCQPCTSMRLTAHSSWP